MALTLKELIKLEGVKDLQPMALRAKFAQALRTENAAGHTTPEALALLDTAIEMEAAQ